MERLILLRHGKAEAEAASGQDFDRALTDRGRADAALVARALAQAGIAPNLALVSPAARAAQTWDAAQSAFPEAVMERAPGLYDIEPDEILRLAQAEAANTVMVVGHNPGLGQLAAFLAARSGADPLRDFPTAAGAVIDFKDGEPTTVRLFLAKALGGGA